MLRRRRFFRPTLWREPRWVAPYWAVDGSGYAYANPPLGAELLTNGGFAADANWTKETGWTIAGGVAVASTATARIYQNVVENGSTGLAGDQLVMTLDIVTRTGGWLRPHIGGTVAWGWQDTGSKKASVLAGGSNAGGLNVVTNFSGTIDNVSLKRLAGTGFAGIKATAPVRQFGVKFPAWQDNHMVQLCAWMDSPASAAPGGYANCNMIICFIRQNSTLSPGQFGIQLFKQVGTTRTGLGATTYVNFSAGALLEFRRTATNTFQVWYNGTQAGSDITISDSQIISNRWFGIVSLSDVQRISEFQIDGRKVPFRF